MSATPEQELRSQRLAEIEAALEGLTDEEIRFCFEVLMQYFDASHSLLRACSNPRLLALLDASLPGLDLLPYPSAPWGRVGSSDAGSERQ